MTRKPQSQPATCNRPPPPPTSATLAWQVSPTLAGDNIMLMLMLILMLMLMLMLKRIIPISIFILLRNDNQ